MEIVENNSNTEFCADLPCSEEKNINVDNQTDISINDVFSNKSTIDSDMKISMSSYNSELDDGQEVFHQDDSSNDDSSDEIYPPVVTDEPTTQMDDFGDKLNLTEVIKESTDSKTEYKLEKKSDDCVATEVDKEKSLNISEDKTKVNKKMVFQKSPESICDMCNKTVYPMEKLMMDSKCYHKNCFKCCKCGKSLNPTVVSKFNNNLFCKPDYISLFRKRGRYDDINVGTEGSNDKGPDKVKDVQHSKVDKNGSDTRKDDRLSSGDVPRSVSDDANSVAGATKAWSETRVLNESEWKRNNINNNSQLTELETANGSTNVSNLKAMFETSQ